MLSLEILGIVIGQIGLGDGSAPLELAAIGRRLAIDDVEKTGQRQVILADKSDLIAFVDAEGDIGKEDPAVFGLLGQLFDIEDLVAYFAQLLEDDARITAVGRLDLFDGQFSRAFFREVACLDLLALAEKRAMNSSSAARLSSVFLFLSDACRATSWEDSYQKV
jgi:hypothetical protein